MSKGLLIPLFLFLIQNVIAVDNPGPLVETNVGWIQGLRATDGDYSMYMGIPYGRVNETNPFGESLPYPNFEGIFSAFDDSIVCPHRQPNGTIMGALDCLRVNIHVPNSVTPHDRVPVMVWIHGGGFSMGHGNRWQFGPKFIVRHDVIFVSINYRLAPYGFMCLDIPEVPGNQGLRDQVRAFRWIKDNIEAFGGDINRITLFGESAGAMSIDFHILSEVEKLYNNVILISGTSLRGKILVRDGDPEAPMKIARQLGFETEDVYEALAFLTTVEPLTLIEANQREGIQYRPCVEKYFEDADNFLIEYPIHLAAPKVKDMPVLIGYSSQEQLGSFSSNNPQSFENINPFNTQLLTLFDFDAEKQNEMQEKVKQFYIGDEPISIFDRLGLIDFDSDIQFNFPVKRCIQNYLRSGVGNLYHYVFSYNGERNWMKVTRNIGFGGAAHSDILGYLFDMGDLPNPITPEDLVVVDRLTTMWTNFAKYSDPTPQTTTLLPVKWEPITQDSPYHFMSIDWRLSMNRKPYNRRMAFWELFYDGNAEFERGY